MDDQVREFVSRVFPWGETEGRFVVSARQGGGFLDSAHDTVEDVLTKAEGWVQRQADVYFTISAQAAGQTVQRVVNGEEQTFPAFRSKEGATLLKAITIDTDVKPGAHADTRSALIAFRKFCEAVKLPVPTAIVYSGTGGFHSHWIFEKGVTREAWSPLAQNLTTAIKAYNLVAAALGQGKDGEDYSLHADLSCTKNAACLFRLPGTQNHKIAPAGEVKLAMKMQADDVDFVDFAGRVEAYLNPVTPAVTGVAPSNVISLHTGKPVVAPVKAGEAVPRALASMTGACSFVGEAVETQGRVFDKEVQWSLATLIAVFTEEGEQAAHLMSQGSPYYKADDVSKKYREKVTARKNGAGFPSCHAISACWSKCSTCPHYSADVDKQQYGDLQSPLHFGRASVEVTAERAQMVDPELPYGYDRRNGIIGRLTQDEDGKMIFKGICGYPFDNGQLYAGMVVSLGFDTRIGDRVTHITLPFPKLASDGLRSVLAEQEMILTHAQSKMVGDFLVAWVTQLQKVKQTVTGEALGWNTENGKVIGFSYNQIMWTPDGPRRTASAEPAIRVKYTPSGSIEPWKEVVDLLLAEKRQCVNAIIAAAFGAPLIKFMGYGGMLYSAWATKSGIGKSLTNEVATAVWAHPIRAKMQLSDTHNAMFQTMGQTNSLPMTWDELKDQSQDSKQVENFVGIVQQITNGKDKSRLDANARLKETASWNTLLIVTSNTSLVQAAIGHSRVTPASMMRVFENEFTAGDPKSPQEKTAMARRVGKLTENYGRAGEIYAEYLGRNHEAIAKAVAKFQDDVAAQIVQGDDERYWSATIAAILAGAHFARLAGLCDIPHAPLKEFLVAELAKMREDRKEVEVDVDEVAVVEGVLSNYIRDSQRRNFIVTDVIPSGQGKPMRPTQILEPSDLRQIERVTIQYAIETQMLRMTVSDFDKWAVLNRQQPGVLKKKFKAMFNARISRLVIAQGTNYGLGREQCMDIPIAGSGLAETLGAQFSMERQRVAPSESRETVEA